MELHQILKNENGNVLLARESWGDGSMIGLNNNCKYFELFTNNKRIPMWHPSKEDLIADDWVIKTEWTLQKI